MKIKSSYMSTYTLIFAVDLLSTKFKFLIWFNFEKFFFLFINIDNFDNDKHSVLEIIILYKGWIYILSKTLIILLILYKALTLLKLLNVTFLINSYSIIIFYHFLLPLS